jgi:glycosyltransferase involved in cell wall biosynthesis
MTTTSVILCTFNRCEILSKALASAAGLELPNSAAWELLVVDNNSTDRTREVVQEFCLRFPSHFRYLFEPRQGKSYALNTGIREARGDVIAFIDDDVVVESSWLHHLTAALHDGHWAGAGGPIRPQQPFTPPDWIPLDDRYALAPLALFDPRLAPGPLAEPPYGTNMAFHRSMFEKYGGFRVDLGPGTADGNPQKSEDSEFGHRLIGAGERLRFEPLAVVYHAVPPSRLEKSYFLDWWFDKSRADIRIFGIPADVRWAVAGIPLYKVRRLVIWTLRWLLALERRRRFGAKLRVWSLAAEIVECYRLTRGGR